MQPLAVSLGSVEKVRVLKAGLLPATDVEFVCYLLAAAYCAWGNTTDSDASIVSLAGGSDLP